MNIQAEIALARRREAEERSAAAKAFDTAVHNAHFGMAARYADRIYALSETPDDEMLRRQ